MIWLFCAYASFLHQRRLHVLSSSIDLRSKDVSKIALPFSSVTSFISSRVLCFRAFGLSYCLHKKFEKHFSIISRLAFLQGLVHGAATTSRPFCENPPPFP